MFVYQINPRRFGGHRDAQVVTKTAGSNTS